MPIQQTASEAPLSELKEVTIDISTIVKDDRQAFIIHFGNGKPADLNRWMVACDHPGLMAELYEHRLNGKEVVLEAAVSGATGSPLQLHAGRFLGWLLLPAAKSGYALKGHITVDGSPLYRAEIFVAGTNFSQPYFTALERVTP